MKISEQGTLSLPVRRNFILPPSKQFFWGGHATPPPERECCVTSTPYAGLVSLRVESFFFSIMSIVSPIGKSLSFDLLHELKPSMIRTLTVLIVCFNVYLFFRFFTESFSRGQD